ncbi:hypothetical protein McanMca71_004840 [Microsporum canis]
MEETLPTPPASPSDGREARSEDVVRAIDDLLERYLHLLDEQQKLQEAIGKQFASGFFSLARANNSCPPGRRYGEDYYDERMKATRHVYRDRPPIKDIEQPGLTKMSSEITMTDPANKSEASLSTPAFKTVTIEMKPDSSNDKDAPNEAKEEEQEEPFSEEVEPRTKTVAETKTSNPLHWFGILVPPPLRNAQEAFCGAVAGPIPALAGVVSEMREVERKVEGLRQLLGVSDTS